MDNKDRIIEDLKGQIELAKRRESDYRSARKATLFMLEDLQATTEKISRAEQEWAATFDSITDPLFIHDRDFKIVRANKAYMALAGLPFVKFIGKPYYEVFPKTGVPFAMCARASGSEEVSATEEISLPDLGRVFKMSNYAVRDSSGKYAYSVHILDDVTAEKEARQRLNDEVLVSSALLGVAEAFSEARSLDVVMAECAESISSTLGADAVLAYLKDRATDSFRPLCGYNILKEDQPAFMSCLLDASNNVVSEVFGASVTRWLEGPDFEGILGSMPDLKSFSGAKRLLIVPLSGKRGPLGLLIGACKSPVEMSEGRQKVLSGIAHQASVALDSITLYKESVDRAMDLARKVETIKVMHEMDKNILSTLDSSVILDTAIRLVTKVIGCDRVSIVRPDWKLGGFVLEACYGVDLPKGYFVPFADTSATSVLKTGAVEFSPNLSEETGLLPLEKMFADAGFCSHIRVPLIVKGSVMALLSVGARRAGIFGSDTLSTLENLASQIGVALENARLVTDLKQTGFELKKLTVALEHSVNLVLITDMKGTVQYVNPMFVDVSGYSTDDAVGQTLRAISLGDMSDDDYAGMVSTVREGRIWRGQLRHSKKTGGEYWSNTDISPVRNEAGVVTNFMVVQEDITEKMASRERLEYLASYDPLTGIFNREHFLELLDQWLNSARPEGWKAALMSIDLDQFKYINETFGHATGDEYLKSLARHIGSSLASVLSRPGLPGAETAFIGRFGADEFLVFLPLVDEDASMGVADEIRLFVGEFRLEGVDASSTASVGIALFPAHASEPRDLITRAQSAMYRAKELGRNVCRLYRPEDMDLEKAHAGLSGKERIIKALKEGRFEPWFQPILDIKRGVISHYEVLARLIDEDGGVLMPGSFIDIAESFGLISSIDRQIIEKTMRLQASLKRRMPNLRFGVNLSGKDLGDSDLLKFLGEKIDESGADPGAMIYEITETAAIRDIDRAVKFIERLKSIGSQIALDDFGVGFTSFTYLKKMQVDYIKIDGSFIKRLHHNSDDQVIVRSITDMASGLGIRSVAEFVEDRQALDLLSSFGVNYAQGYLIGKPAPEILDEDDMHLRLGAKAV